MKIYAVMEMCGNFSHTLEEFDNRDSAAEFEIELENKLSYYSIDEQEV